MVSAFNECKWNQTTCSSCWETAQGAQDWGVVITV